MKSAARRRADKRYRRRHRLKLKLAKRAWFLRWKAANPEQYKARLKGIQRSPEANRRRARKKYLRLKKLRPHVLRDRGRRAARRHAQQRNQLNLMKLATLIKS